MLSDAVRTIENNTLSCQVPPSLILLPENTVSLTYLNQRYETNKLTISIREQPTVYRISPTNILKSNEEVIVRGSGFSESLGLFCSFSSYEAPLTIISANEGKCSLKPRPPGTSDTLSVKLDTFTLGTVSLSYLDSIIDLSSA